MKAYRLFSVLLAFLFCLLAACQAQTPASSDNAEQTESTISTSAGFRSTAASTQTTQAAGRESSASHSASAQTTHSAATTTTAAAATGPVTLNWQKAQQAYASRAYGGVACPRMLTLANGTILCAFDANDTQGGNSVIKVIQSPDGGKTWTGTSKTNENAVMKRSDTRSYANPSLLQLDNGDVLVAYRGMSASSGVKDSGLFVSVSHDNGLTWNSHSTILDYTQHDGGVYEPCLLYIGGVVTVYYANDSVAGNGEAVGTGFSGKTPQPAVTTLAYQNIEYMQWNGSSWGNRTIACNGKNANSRDGMPSLTQLQDGRWMLAYEANNTAGKYPFILRYKLSDDGLNWNTASGSGNGTAYCIPKLEGRKTSGPALVTLPDGRIVCAFQTDQDATKAGDATSVFRLMISKTADPAEGWGEWQDTFQTPDGKNSFWNSIAISGNTLFALTSTNYPSNSVYIRRAFME